MKNVPPWFVPTNKGSDNKSHVKLYDLKWNKQDILTAKPYAVCKAKENELVRAGTHSRNLFTKTKSK